MKDSVKTIIIFTLLIIILSSAFILFANKLLKYHTFIILIISISSIALASIAFFAKTIVENTNIVIERNNKPEFVKQKKEEEKAEKFNPVEFLDKSLNEHIEEFLNKQLIKIAKHFNIDQIIFYLKDNNNIFKIYGKYAFVANKNTEFKKGEGISGQVVKDKQTLYITDIPEGYITIISGLGKGNPKSLYIVPAIYENEVIGLVELASLHKIEENNRKKIEQIISEIAKKLVNVK